MSHRRRYAPVEQDEAEPEVLPAIYDVSLFKLGLFIGLGFCTAQMIIGGIIAAIVYAQIANH